MFTSHKVVVRRCHRQPPPAAAWPR